jgi:hypothetical protein
MRGYVPIVWKIEAKKRLYRLPCFRKYINLRLILKPANLKELTILNIGMGDGLSKLAQQLYGISFKRLDIVDVYQPYLDGGKLRRWATKEINFIKTDIRDFDVAPYDVVLALDVLEHMTKEDALGVIDRVKSKFIVFIPLEKEPQSEVREIESENHLSLWTEEDFIQRGFKTEILKDFHKENGKSCDALWGIRE